MKLDTILEPGNYYWIDHETATDIELVISEPMTVKKFVMTECLPHIESDDFWEAEYRIDIYRDWPDTDPICIVEVKTELKRTFSVEEKDEKT